ncbi:hypothetical protein [Lacinutrix sp. 5H-3-7-4]|uniref:hypothetical protein n=1 Tax=Lacinutrix sp. (strain 5H-3-7-4) TaxID=983544 RepID=UPI00020A3568|nr:hypothetical protein [Lacinutrix sp. 5H-3-7-4]AEH01729.1 hypothetical protein Lacal_1883 [Lacinutrix sp. 5H-3-7-4]
MNKIITVFFIFFISLSYAQKIKKNQYYSYEFKEISKDSFYSLLDKDENLTLKYENDSTYINAIFKIKRKASFTKDEFNNLKKKLEVLSNKKIDLNSTIIINYLSKNPKIKDSINKTKWNIFHKKYLKKIKKELNVSVFWINNPLQKNLRYYRDDLVNWIEDKDHYFRDLLFPYDFLYGSFSVIDNQGNYISNYGEYGKQQVIEYLEELNKKK